jgi:hypothetical protein
MAEGKYRYGPRIYVWVRCEGRPVDHKKVERLHYRELYSEMEFCWTCPTTRLALFGHVQFPTLDHGHYESTGNMASDTQYSNLVDSDDDFDR